MRYLKRRRQTLNSTLGVYKQDPMEGVANLFDVAMVFALGLMVALISAYSLMDLFNPSVETTLLKKKATGEIEIVSKKAKEIKVKRVTGKQLQGEGIRLGVAYRLKDGKVVYVPESSGAERE